MLPQNEKSYSLDDLTFFFGCSNLNFFSLKRERILPIQKFFHLDDLTFFPTWKIFPNLDNLNDLTKKNFFGRLFFYFNPTPSLMAFSWAIDSFSDFVRGANSGIFLDIPIPLFSFLELYCNVGGGII